MDWIAYTSELNGQGVQLLGFGDDALALEYFKVALETISYVANACNENGGSVPKMMPPVPRNLHLVAPKTASVGAPNLTPPMAATDAPQYRPHETESTSAAEPWIHSASVKNGGDNHFVYTKALTFTSTPVLSPANISFYIGVIEFNMGLTLHFLSRRLGEKFLFSALTVYDFSLEHIKNSGYGIECSKLLLFAALNNKAALLYDLSSYETARDVLTSLLDSIHNCKKAGILSSIDDQDLEGFLFNVMLLRGATIAPAA
ncbi:expressed unknown protein [Seminavis robusta]|uniref:Uncharacterized protein n=1 Tax=Seminavis robusta TaxID=568900 RepID=A0A9N8DB73_9STRA|nr:expressed unknown protein [Seminavis robusta]|eukprot:Sro69_g038510.1 n/a (259) ;mRNA; f:40039-40815